MTRVAYEPEKYVDPRYIGAQEAPESQGGFFSSFGASFGRESDINALINLATRDELAPDMEFDFDARAKQSATFARNAEPFFKARSAAEFTQIEQRINEEELRLNAAQASGLGAFLGGMSGALLSPTTFIPGGAVLRGAKLANILRSSATVGLAAGSQTILQEGILQADQLTRTAEESATNTLFALALGGMIGGAVGALSKGQIGKMASDMASNPSKSAIHIAGETEVLGEAKAAGADITIPTTIAQSLGDVKGIAPSIPGMDVLANLNPVARGLANSDSAMVRNLTGSLDSGGLYTTGMPNYGGDVLSRAKAWHFGLYNVLKKRGDIMGGSKLAQIFGVRKFAEEAAFASRRGGEHADPAVMAYAKAWKDDVYTPLLKEAQALGMKNFIGLDDEYIAKYVNRMPISGKVAKDHDRFTGMIYEHFTEQMQQKWDKAASRVEESNAKLLETADDLALDSAGVVELRRDLEAQIANLPNNFSQDVIEAVDRIRALRAEAKVVGKEEGKAMRAQAAAIEKSNKDLLADFSKQERKIKGRFRSLGRTASGLAAKQQAALTQAQALQEAADATRGALVRRVNKIMTNLEKWDDAKLDLEIDKLEAQLERTYGVWERGDAKLSELTELPEDFRELEFSDIRPTDQISKVELAQTARREKLDNALEKLEEAKSLDREGKRATIEQLAKALVQDAERVNAKRAAQEAKLNERIKNADPRNAELEALALRDKAEARLYDLDAKVRSAGGKTVDGKRDFSQTATDFANYIARVYRGNVGDVPFLTVQRERGPELARMLNIDETRVWSNGAKMEDFIENDIEILGRSYIRTMAADIELHRKFGTVSPMAPESGFTKQITEDYDAARKAARVEAEAKLTKGQSEAKVQKALDKRMTAIATSESNAFRDLDALVQRIRHTRGLPDDATSIGHRLGKTALNLNTVRLMGNMVITSAADMAAVVIKHGFMSTFSDGFVPLVKNMKAFRLSAQEAQQAGVALDLMLHGRASALFDVMDEIRGGTIAERGLQYATNHMGSVTLMDRWNSGMKQFEAVLSITKMSQSLEALSGTNPKAKAKALRYLERLGIDENMGQKMWAQLKESGDVVDGITLPNTEKWGTKADAAQAAALKTEGELSAELKKAQIAWDRAEAKAAKLIGAMEQAEGLTPAQKASKLEGIAKAEELQKQAQATYNELSDKYAKAFNKVQQLTVDNGSGEELRRIFHAAIARSVDDTIVTPGGERPLWMDANMLGRLIGQFRSFTFSSTQKIIWAGAQDMRAGELAPLGGMVFSVALGALSYYIKQSLRSEEAREKVQNASVEKLLLEGIKASLVLGVMAEAQSFAEDIPGPIGQAATLGSSPGKRNVFGNPIANLGGPTPSLVKELGQVVSDTLSGDVDEKTISAARRLTPYNNVFWASRAFNAVERGLAQ